MLGAVLDTDRNIDQHGSCSECISFDQSQSDLRENPFTGDGFDAWGLSLDNNTLPYFDQPVAYTWNFGTI